MTDRELMQQEPVAQELVDKAGSPCPEFWDWLPKTYRDGDKGADPKFTKYNMEVAYLAGSTTYKELLNKSEVRLHEVAVHCERVERRLKEVNTAAMNLTHDLVCMDYDDDDRLDRDRVMERIMQWRNEWDKAIMNNKLQMQPCAGRNCGSTNPNLHSAECFEDYEKSTGMAQPDAYGYASRLAVAIWEQHYKDVAPQWKPLDDLLGVLTQIDNMTSGLTRLAQPEQEPVAWISESENLLSWDKFYDHMTPLYTAPRQWVELTDDEARALVNRATFGDRTNWQALVYMIDAKLKEKNA